MMETARVNGAGTVQLAAPARPTQGEGVSISTTQTAVLRQVGSAQAVVRMWRLMATPTPRGLGFDPYATQVSGETRFRMAQQQGQGPALGPSC